MIISLANSREVLYLVNRPGNVVSHEGCVPWIDRAIDLVRPHAGEITLRGDSDFTLSAQLDRWDSQGIKFIFGMDAHPKVVQLAEALPAEAWKPLERLARYEIATEPRRKPHRIKEAIVRFKGYPNKKLIGETVAEFDYQPLKCGRSYRLVVVRKNISVQKGELVLFEDIKYFFYITNHTNYSAEQIVALANERCEQENVIEQLKNGVNAMRMPVDDLISNWAYMVMSALAWNLKSWYGLLMPNRQRGLELVRMEFRRFLHAIVLLPAQIVRSGRKIIYRIMGYNSWLKDFFAAWGETSSDGACLKQLFTGPCDARGGTLPTFQHSVAPWRGINRLPAIKPTLHISVILSCRTPLWPFHGRKLHICSRFLRNCLGRTRSSSPAPGIRLF